MTDANREQPCEGVDAALLESVDREGVESLATERLLALVAGTHVLGGLASELVDLSRRSTSDLVARTGLERVAAVRLAASFALGRRVERAVRAPSRSLRSPASVHELMAPELRGLQRESFHVLLLDGKHKLRRRERISEGTLTSSLVHPREVFAPALREGAAALIVVHNHPSGDPEPSREDLQVTRRLLEVADLVGVPLLDHVVVADERYVSLRERMPFA